MSTKTRAAGGLAVAALAAVACGQGMNVFPTGPHAASNYIPFGSGATTMHQVFASSLFSALNNGDPVQIEAIAFSPGVAGTFPLGPVTINLGYTDKQPMGLAQPSSGQNPRGPMTLFFTNPSLVVAPASFGTEAWSEMNLVGTPFVYDPGEGNLLVEILLPSGPSLGLHVSRAAASAESTRAYDTAQFGNGANVNATRMRFSWSPASVCYPDCDTSTGPGVLDVFDFLCFQNRYDAGNPYACDCDTSTGPGVCDVFDFLCFQNAYDAGCP